MDNNNHSHSRRRKHTSNGGAAFLYDDVYGGPATSSNSLSPRLEDYSEIFGAFSASRASSIPTLHLPVAADEDGDEFFDVRSSGFDYSEVFGGFEALDFAVAYEDLIKPPPKNDGADSSDEAWTPEGSGSVSGESNHSLKNQSFSDDHYYSYNDSSEFGISHDKAHKKSGKESLKGRAYVNPVTAASEYSFMADEVTAVRETEFDNSRWKVTEDRKFNVDMLNEEHLRKNVSPASNGSSAKQTYGDSWKPERVSGRNGSRNKVPFVTISDINLRTQPSHLPPPYRPPPIVNGSSGDSSRLSSNSNTVSSDGRIGDISPPFFDVEVDASSSAAVSAAAMIEAMEKASIQLRTAKELMQRKKEGSHSRSKSRSKKDNKEVGKVGKYDDGSGSKSDNKARATSEIDDSKMKFSVSEKPKVMKKVREEPETLRDEKSSEATRSVVHEKHAKGSWASQVSFKIDEASEWQEATQYFELVALDDNKQALELGNKDKISGETAKADDPEVLEQKRSELEACNARSKDAKSQVRKEHEKMVKVSQGTFEKGENEMDSGMGKLPAAELEKHRGRSVKSERYENMAEVQGKENKFGIENALQQNHTELKFKENDRAIRFEERCKEFHGTEGIENRQKSSEQDENERRLVGAFKQAESEKRLMELLEKEKRLKETQEQVENEKRLKKALELQESEKKLKEALEQEKRRKEAAQREENEKRLKEALEKEENEKRLKEENEKRLRKALEMQESEKKMKEASDQENQRRQKEAAQREESEKRLKEALEFEEYQKRQNDSHEVEDHRFSDDTCNQVCNENPKGTQIARNNDENSETMKEYQEAHAHKENGKKKSNSNHSDTLTGPEVVKMTNGPVDEQSSCLSGSSQAGTESGNSYFSLDDAYQSIPFVNFVKKAVEAGSGPENPEPRSNSMSQKDYGHETQKMECAHERENRERDAKQVHASSNREEHMPAPVKEFVDSRRRTEAAKPAVTEINNRKSSQHVNASQAPGGMVKNLKEDPLNGDRERERLKRETELENDRLRKIEEEREREREKDRMSVDRETLEARDWAYVEARERAERVALERATADARQKAMAEARERLEKACADAREKSLAGKAAMEARLRAERAAVERATAEARERAAEKLMDERERVQRTVSDKFSTSSRNNDMRHCSSSSDLQDPHTSRHPYSTANGERYGDEGESPQRCKARLERHARTTERAAKALAEKNMRDLLAQREQAENNRLAETLDADVKRWSSGKEGNLRALLSTLQYILGSDSGWQPIPLTEVITAAAVKKAYRKATLCVHPDKLQQRGASIHQKYICEKVFDLLKEAWNKFNSEER